MAPKRLLRIFWLYVALVGFVTFPLFILEESIQMATWGTWAAKDAKDTGLQLKGILVIEKLNTVMSTVNRVAGWIQPLSMLGYDGYSQATEIYVQSVMAKLLAHDPDHFVGQRVSFEFTPKEIRNLEDGRFLLVNGRISVMAREATRIGTLTHVEGVMQEIDGRLTVMED